MRFMDACCLNFPPLEYAYLTTVVCSAPHHNGVNSHGAARSVALVSLDQSLAVEQPRREVMISRATHISGTIDRPNPI